MTFLRSGGSSSGTPWCVRNYLQGILAVLLKCSTGFECSPVVHVVNRYGHAGEKLLQCRHGEVGGEEWEPLL